MRIISAKSAEQLETIRELFREYEGFLQVDLCFQGFEAELAGLPGRYAPPEGALILAEVGETAAGCVAMRKQDVGVCEMKRLYVRPAFRNQGVGRRLAQAIIKRAKAKHYRAMRLDTLEKLKAAIQLYEDLGFRPCPPYYHNPLPGVLYWELDMTTGP